MQSKQGKKWRRENYEEQVEDSFFLVTQKELVDVKSTRGENQVERRKRTAEWRKIQLVFFCFFTTAAAAFQLTTFALSCSSANTRRTKAHINEVWIRVRARTWSCNKLCTMEGGNFILMMSFQSFTRKKIFSAQLNSSSYTYHTHKLRGRARCRICANERDSKKNWWKILSSSTRLIITKSNFSSCFSRFSCGHVTLSWALITEKLL